MPQRPMLDQSRAVPTIEGAGVHLHRAFGFGDTAASDPFLLLDDFRNDREEAYRPGFPWHPHRGMETITYVLAGSVEHQDNLGNRGRIGPGDVQWMTAGRGVLHQEMPRGDADGRMHGFQLWANLPAKAKMVPPRYQEIRAAAIPELAEADGARVRIVCGEYGGRRGPVEGVAADPVYLDVELPAGLQKVLPLPRGRQGFAYVFAGSGRFGAAAAAGNRTLVRFGDGDEVAVLAGDDGVRFLFVHGVPLREPVAWRGPIVMNTEAELRQAFAELQSGSFAREGR